MKASDLAAKLEIAQAKLAFDEAFLTRQDLVALFGSDRDADKFLRANREKVVRMDQESRRPIIQVRYYREFIQSRMTSR